MNVDICAWLSHCEGTSSCAPGARADSAMPGTIDLGLASPAVAHPSKDSAASLPTLHTLL